jgi:hypothetical protein
MAVKPAARKPAAQAVDTAAADTAATARGPAPKPPAGSVGELIEFTWAPKGIADPCPTWPPDVFAIAATVMRRNGAYVHCVKTPASSTAVPIVSLGANWADTAQRVGERWNKAILKALKKNIGPGKQPFGAVVSQVPVPPEVSRAWQRLTEHGAVTAIESSRDHPEIARALIELCAYADEASAGLGLPGFDDKDEFSSAASFFLNRNQRLSFCLTVDVQKARVLGKKHTPQQGLTLRSISHHLSLCLPWEVEAQWFEVDARGLDDVLNLLLLPWPLKVRAANFRPMKADDVDIAEEHRTFDYMPDKIKDLERHFADAIKSAKAEVTDLHAVVLPELALTLAEWSIAEKIALEQGVLLISGIVDDRDELTGLPVNSCRIQMASLRYEKSGTSQPADLPAYQQAKHHRWCLDRNQVLQYDLGGQLPSAVRCWENSHIGRRRIFFATLGGWLTFSVLICEDLARQDPIAEVLRSVGPNLVVALLMDGPQLNSRWPARYASVLADDPGSSVLTLTSLGMCTRSQPPSALNQEPSTVIALWKDKLYGAREVALKKDSVGCVLSLTCAMLEEFTADGRSDHKSTQVPVFSGITQIFPTPN